jgi:hypothetical protein
MGNPQIDQIRAMLAENPIIPDGASLEEMRQSLDAMTAATPRLAEVHTETIHVWHLFAPMLDKGQEAIDRMADFITGHTA